MKNCQDNKTYYFDKPQMSKGYKYFFRPRVINDAYEAGWEGYRTLVLGVFHVCSLECVYKEECLAYSSDFDLTCPVYAGRGEYFHLSNSNEIEIESYLENAAKYPTYNNISKYLLKTNQHSSEAKLRNLWDHIAFTNFLQDFQGDESTLSYKNLKKRFDKDLPAFEDVLTEYKPEVIYVFDTAVADCLKANSNSIPGLSYLDEDQDWPLPVYRFLYNVQSKDEPQNIISDVKSLGRADIQVKYERIIKAIENQRIRQGTLKDEKLRIELLPHIWDEHLLDYLYISWFNSMMSDKDKRLLEKVLNNLFENDYTQCRDKLLFNEDNSFLLEQYKRDGVAQEILETINNQRGTATKIPAIAFLKSVGIRCKSQQEWRTVRKKEYDDYVKNGCNAIKNLVAEMMK